MGLDIRTVNTLWASVFVETLAHLGLTTAIACPGSRSTPLTLALATHPAIETLPILDERSAAFFALGVARRSHQPVVLVCTSGTAGANFYPAVIEAQESGVPLIIVTADRPPELRDCQAGQTIDQQKLYGTVPNWYHEVMVPTAVRSHLAYLRQTLVQAWQRALFPRPGVVHLNCPFRDPLAPQPDAPPLAIAPLEFADFFTHLARVAPAQATPQLDAHTGAALIATWRAAPTGILIAGPAQPADPVAYCQAIAALSQYLGWVVLAEALSPLRQYASLNPHLVAGYDWLLRQPTWADRLHPHHVIQIGPLPTSKVLRQWLEQGRAQRWVIDPSDRSLDPGHGATVPVPVSVMAIAGQLPQPAAIGATSAYTQTWLALETQVQTWLTAHLTATTACVEPWVSWQLAQHLPPQTPLFIANSMPVRDWEWFCPPGDRALQPYFNRGANGIDGTLSTALGMAHRQPPSVLLTGDLALLHDTNGWLIQPYFQGQLTIALLNNHGGGIFELLPIAAHDPPFEQFFATPQVVNFAQLAAAYGVEYHLITTQSALRQAIATAPAGRLRLWEIQVDRKQDQAWRQALFQAAIAMPWSVASLGSGAS